LELDSTEFQTRLNTPSGEPYRVLRSNANSAQIWKRAP
jgi:hypothetical protein